MSILLQVILPVFALIALGYLSARLTWVSEEGLRGLNDFVFRLAMPSLILNGATTPHEGGGATAVAFFSGCLLAYALAMLLGRRALRPHAAALAARLRRRAAGGVSRSRQVGGQPA